MFAASEPSLRTRSRHDEMIAVLADPVAEAMGYEIVRIRVLSGKRQTVQIMAEKADGTMDVEDCARLSRALSDVFETNDPISGEYVLEVSSPGIDRPLTMLAHFERWEGFEAKIELDRLVENRKRFRGVLAGIEDGNVLIDLDGEEETAVLPFDWIAEARLVLTDALIAESLKGRGGEAPVWTDGAETVTEDTQTDKTSKTNR
ncbi:ribosome maturation factor RimP [Glycocaulis albus]